MRIESIADHLDLVETIACWHWDEWGHADPSGSLESWTEGLRERTSRDSIPTTYVALEEDGTLLGSVTLVEHDMTTHLDLTPWLAGVFVRPERRNRGVGSALVRHAVQMTAKMGVARLYLYTASARDFYARLGWQRVADDSYEGQTVTIMTAETRA